MKKLLYFLPFVIAFIAGCNSNKNAEAGIPVTADSLTGNWMIVKLSTTSNNKDKESKMKSFVNPLKNKIEASIYSFQPTGALLIDEGNLTLTNGNWDLSNSGQLLLREQDSASTPTSIRFSITGYRHDSLILENIFDNKKEELHITYTLKRLKNNDSVPNLFEPALNKWRQRPPQPESEEAIRLRVKQILTYYSAYFANISRNKINFFNTEKVHCPLMFYDGSLELREFLISDEWTKLFFDNRNAETAHALLGEAFAKFKNYPDKGNNNALEFSIALKSVADQL